MNPIFFVFSIVKLVDAQAYLVELVRYLHLNPVRVGK
jgi:hypothetical protein